MGSRAGEHKEILGSIWPPAVRLLVGRQGHAQGADRLHQRAQDGTKAAHIRRRQDLRPGTVE